MLFTFCAPTMEVYPCYCVTVLLCYCVACSVCYVNKNAIRNWLYGCNVLIVKLMYSEDVK